MDGEHLVHGQEVDAPTWQAGGPAGRSRTANPRGA
jgi:hypothetical protein